MAEDISSRIRQNLADVRGRIAHSAQQSGRQEGDVTLVAVTKYVGIAQAGALLEAGCEDLGESRPQQLWEKAADPALAAARWHLVGHLQRNKIARTLPLIALIHSVDSLRLLRAIDAQSAERPAQVLLEVNISGDEAKHGFDPEEVESLEQALDDCPHVRVRGLMAMAARVGGAQRARGDFAALRQLRDRLQAAWHERHQLDTLSMGMSGDFEQAILEGATIVRVGSALFTGIDEHGET